MKIIFAFSFVFFIIIVIAVFFGITSPLCGKKYVLTFKNYPLSEIARTLPRMKVVPSNAAFCKQIITMDISWFLDGSLVSH